MKKHKQIIIFSSLFIFLSFGHPIKLTSSIIRYDSETQIINMECKVFIDDFSPAIGPNIEQRVNNEILSSDDLLSI